MNKKTEKEMAGEITDMLNSFNFNQDEFNQAMSNEHRTLQQNFTRMCLKWIEHMATTDTRFTDHRNKDSVLTSAALIEMFKSKMGYLPSESLPNI